MSVNVSSGNWLEINAAPAVGWTVLMPVYFTAVGSGTSNQAALHVGDGTWSLFDGFRATGGIERLETHRADGGGQQFGILRDGTLAAATWYHVMLVYTPESGGGGNGVLTGRISLDGSTWATTATITGLSDITATWLLLGVIRTPEGSDPMDGRIGATKVWSRELTDSEGLDELPYRAAVDATGLWAEWRMASGALTTDSSGNGRTLTAQGTPTHQADEPSWIEGDSPAGGETVMDADPASFTITGSASDSVRALLIDADPATYQITGASADTLRSLLMDADAASMAVTGASADTLRALILTADPASFEVTGAAADTLRALLMQADPGAMTITGAAADTVTGAEIFMDADPASFAITGASSDLLRNLVMVADPAGYAITGAPADLLRALVMAADAASLTITGAASDTVRGIIMDADAAVFEVTGAAADSLRALLMDADAGALVISGASADTIATGEQAPLQPPYTAVWIDPERGAVWIAVNRDASFIDPDRKAHWS